MLMLNVEGLQVCGSEADGGRNQPHNYINVPRVVQMHEGIFLSFANFGYFIVEIC